jgi:hypothetical protein
MIHKLNVVVLREVKLPIRHPLKSPQPPFVKGGQGGFLGEVWSHGGIYLPMTVPESPGRLSQFRYSSFPSFQSSIIHYSGRERCE